MRKILGDGHFWSGTSGWNENISGVWNLLVMPMVLFLFMISMFNVYTKNLHQPGNHMEYGIGGAPPKSK